MGESGGGSRVARFRVMESLKGSKALWNRTELDLRSDEILAQLLDRGSLEDWRAIYKMARLDSKLRHRVLMLVYRVPLPFPRFWLAALANLGEPVDFSLPVPRYDAVGT